MELTRQDRKAAVASLSSLAEQISEAAIWLDARGNAQQDADRAAVLLECAARDLLAACWLLRPADHTRPEGWLDNSRAIRP